MDGNTTRERVGRLLKQGKGTNEVALLLSVSRQLHHINGDGLDNRLANLSLLCPNCHSQTPTWGGKNKPRQAAA